MPKGACSLRVTSAVSGAMVAVSGEQYHSGLGPLAWEQGLDVGSFVVRSPKMAIELLMSHVAVYGYLKEPASQGLVGL